MEKESKNKRKCYSTHRNTSMTHFNTVTTRGIATLKVATMVGVLLHSKKATLTSDSTDGRVWPTSMGAGMGGGKSHDGSTVVCDM